MVRYKLIIIFCFYSLNSQSQSSDLEYCAYNIGIGGIIGGVGSIINKKDNQSTLECFLKGFGNGALGGYVTFESKRVLSLGVKEQDLKMYWFAKTLNAAGTSMKENAALNRGLWKHWHINFGFNRVEFHQNDEFEVKYKLMPVSLAFIARAFIVEEFDLGRTLQFGEFFFWSKTTVNAGYYVPGMIALNSIYLDKNLPIDWRNENIYKISGHEIIHLYQSHDFLQLNSLYHPKINKILERNQLRFVDKYLYLDTHHALFFGLYKINTNHEKNFFEKEAFYWSE